MCIWWEDNYYWLCGNLYTTAANLGNSPSGLRLVCPGSTSQSKPLRGSMNSAVADYCCAAALVKYDNK